jgi:hypothetical protein
MKYEKLMNLIINYYFQTLYLKKPKNDDCLTGGFLGCGDSG